MKFPSGEKALSQQFEFALRLGVALIVLFKKMVDMWFAISSRCTMYGTGCIRSDYRDFDGDIHGTAEPRPATTQDPPFSEVLNGGSRR
ncbi:MAG: hypothetical protein WB795_12690 [Candidatus Acidiferrales bacterium]|jgi:hypothetical protein